MAPHSLGLVRAELPAVKKEDVKVTIDNGMLKIEFSLPDHRQLLRLRS